MSVPIMRRVGNEERLSHVSVHAELGLGHMLQRSFLPWTPQVEVDMFVLEDLLDSMGEFKDNRRVPLAIMLQDRPKNINETVAGTAMPIWKDEGRRQLVGRIITLPLFELDIEVETSDERACALYCYMQNELAETAVHELKHAVDFLDDEVMYGHYAYRSLHKALLKEEDGGHPGGYDSARSYRESPIEIRAREEVARLKKSPASRHTQEAPGLLYAPTVVVNEDEGLPGFIKLRYGDRILPKLTVEIIKSAPVAKAA